MRSIPQTTKKFGFFVIGDCAIFILKWQDELSGVSVFFIFLLDGS